MRVAPALWIPPVYTIQRREIGVKTAPMDAEAVGWWIYNNLNHLPPGDVLEIEREEHPTNDEN